MPEHPFSPQDFPINTKRKFSPTNFFLLKGCIHFKKNATIMDLSGRLKSPWSEFSQDFLRDVENVSKQMEEREESPAYEITSCGDMMRTIKTMNDSSGKRVCDLNITFVSFDSSMVRFANNEDHCRHPIEMCPVDAANEKKHECFVRHSIPYFWDMTGQFGILYKCLNQKRVEIGRVAAYGFGRDAVLALEGHELDAVCALSTCVILLNGRDAMDH